MKSASTIGRLLLGLLYLSIALAVIVAALFVVNSKKAAEHKIILGGEIVNVDIADTTALQESGLSGRKSLGGNEGMLFVFPQSGRVGFWMKDMLFPIDIIWFNSNHQIVDVWENASPSSYPEVYTPQGDAQYVIEVTAGFYSAQHLKLGDVFEQTQ